MPYVQQAHCYLYGYYLNQEIFNITKINYFQICIYPMNLFSYYKSKTFSTIIIVQHLVVISKTGSVFSYVTF